MTDSKWNSILEFYNSLISNGFKLRPIRFIVRHIIDKGYSKVMHPGTSMYSLLISIPKDGVINYDRTLKISYDNLKQTLNFVYSNKGIKHYESCQATEGIDTLEHFFNSFKEWKSIIK